MVLGLSGFLPVLHSVAVSLRVMRTCLFWPNALNCRYVSVSRLFQSDAKN